MEEAQAEEEEGNDDRAWLTPRFFCWETTEYALAAVNQGVTSLGIKGLSFPIPSLVSNPFFPPMLTPNSSFFLFTPHIATNGIVLATEKKSTSSLINPSSLEKISLITPNIGMVYSGMGPDFRVLVDRARKVSHTNYKRIYNEYPPTRILVQDVARVMQEATQSGGVRPYGVSLLVAGWDEHTDTPALYQVDPSGSYFPWKATAIGKSATSAKTFLEKRYAEGLELEDAIHIALLTLKEGLEGGELNGDTVEIGIVGPPADHLLGYEGVEGKRGPRFRKLSPQEIEDYLTNL